jgi:hypothetical protein
MYIRKLHQIQEHSMLKYLTLPMKTHNDKDPDKDPGNQHTKHRVLKQLSAYGLAARDRQAR